MLKKILKKSFSDICASFSIILVAFLISSYFPHYMNYPPHQKLFFYEMLFKVILGLVIIATVGTFINHFIMEFELFSKKKFMRRSIFVVIIALLSVVVNLSVFFILPLSKTYVVTGVIIIVLLGVIGATIGFIIENKKRKKDIEAINERLIKLKEEH